MKTGREIIYWDACIFLAWLQNEPCEPGVMEGIEETVRQVNDNEAVLVTSVMTQTEVLESKMSRDAQTKFENLFKRRNVVWINHDTRIGKLSHDIRDYYDQRSVKLSSPDSIHLASAILYDVSVLYTLDGSGKKKRGYLLPLNGNVAGHPLKIAKPYKSQLSLRLVPEEPKQKGKQDEKTKAK
ncbi:MAG TPA: PIN domain-containing protein [Pyrinomonadaceae bacterium]|jgi:hypothetical protein|nr:PIN domain-containing protein [Pyrinomonadaceae bacterium]